jgi:tRNA1Val (adenine37-N6)-methyltransferase
MGNAYFQFKRFKILQDKCAMKVGTDGVLLGAWTPVERAQTILDVGSGTGLLSLMLAQRAPEAMITGVELDSDACAQSRENIQRSPWNSRIEVLEADFRQFSQQSRQNFDLIVSNPPYFIDSQHSGDESRSLARHTSRLSYAEFIEGVLRLLTPEGLLSVILPALNYPFFSKLATNKGLFNTNRLLIYPTPHKPVSRILSVWDLKGECEKKEEKMVLEIKGRHNYSAEYLSLTHDFYLKS